MTWPEWITWDRVLAWLVGLGGFVAFVAREHVTRWMDHRWARRKQQEQADVALLQAFLQTLPSNGSVQYFKEQNMGDSFAKRQLDTLDDFSRSWAGPEKAFHDKRLKEKLEGFRSAIDSFIDSVTENASVVNGNGERLRVPVEWRERNFEKYWQVTKSLNQMARNLAELHADLVRTGRAKLKC